jgi:Carboxypeptidase regulatory-like domain
MTVSGNPGQRLLKVSFLALLAAFISTVPGHVLAQISSASLSGTIKDPVGAIVPDATVTLRNVDTSVSTTTVSNGDGNYTFQNLNPGNYTVEATAKGFQLIQVPPFTLTVGQKASINFSLVVGSASTVVTVQDITPQLDVSSANLGSVIATQQVNDLPLNGRNFTQLLQLTPGVSPVSVSQNSNKGAVGSFSVQAAAAGSSFYFPAVNGQSNRSNLFFLDGLFDQGTLLSTYALPPIVDAIQEFKLVSHTDGAEYGSGTGGVVNVVSKSGTNSLHGSAWSYYRDDIFDGRSFFLPPATPKSPYHQNQFGVAGGGPVFIPKLYNGKNKTFFYAAYQGFRYSLISDTPLTVPTAAQLSGDESTWPTQIYNPFTTVPNPNAPGEYIRQPFVGNQIPANLINPQIVAYSKFIFPAAGPVFDSAGDNALDTTPTTQNQNEFTARVDQTLGEKNSLWFRYSLFRSNSSGSGGLPGLPDITTTPATNYGGSFSHIFNPGLILQVQIGHVNLQDNSSTRFTQSTSAINTQVGFSSTFTGGFLAANGNNLIPSPGITGYKSAGEAIQNEPKETDSSQYSGNVTKILGNHTIEAGGGYITAGFSSPIGSDNLGFVAQNTGDTNPADTVNTGDPMASFLLNVPGTAGRRNVNETERPGGVLSAYVQDSWKALPNLTLNLGLRYDITFIPPYGLESTAGQQGGIEAGDMDFNNGTYIVQKVPGACSVTGQAPCIPGSGALPANVIASPNQKISNNVPTNFGPRFGFAYQLDPKTVVHGAFGIMYDNWSGVTQTSNNIEGTWPDIGQELANNLNQPSSASAIPTVTAQNPFGTTGLFPAATPFNQVQYFYDPKYKNPYSEQFNFGVSRQIDQSTNATVNYVGSANRRLDVGGYYNTALTPGPGDPQTRALFPGIAPTFYDRWVGSSSYNGLQASLERRFSKGLSYQVAYTWSKSIDVGGDGLFGVEGGVPQDPYNPALFGSRSVAGTDLRNILSINTVYEIPVGTKGGFSTGNRAADYVLGNWQVNGIFIRYSGLPFTPVISSDIANTGNGGTYETLDVVGNPRAISHRSAAEWFNTAAYAAPAQYTYGTAGRNSLLSAPYLDLDTSVFRQFPIREGLAFVFRLEAFNTLNNVVLGNPANNTSGAGNDINAGPSFGTIDTTANTARQLQIALKVVF